jgi:hypothetical protein
MSCMYDRRAQAPMPRMHACGRERSCACMHALLRKLRPMLRVLLAPYSRAHACVT